VQRIVEAVRPLRRRFELILVDDGSRDATLTRLRGLLAEVPELVVLALRRNFGQTAALQAGFDRARGDVIVTLDGDLQNDPRDIPRLLEALARGADVVSGWRRGRQDAFVVRKIPSWIANQLIRVLTRVPIHDQGCSLKAYRREVIRMLDLYSDMHRFIAVLTLPAAAAIAEVEVTHHARQAGASKYGLSRVLKVLADLATIQMLTRFQERPARGFALLGLPFLTASLALGAAAGLGWGGPVVAPTTALFAGLVFVSCLLAGLLGEVIVESAGTRAERRVLSREWGGGA
jgi:hypothetical protein